MKKHEIVQEIHKYWSDREEKKFIPGKTYIPPSAPYIDADDIATVADTLLKGWFTEGEYCRKFEDELKRVTGKKHCLLTNSGSSASLLAVSARALKAPNKKYFVTCASGFPTTIAPIYQNNCVPIFIDIDPHT